MPVHFCDVATHSNLNDDNLSIFQIKKKRIAFVHKKQLQLTTPTSAQAITPANNLPQHSEMFPTCFLWCPTKL